MKNPASNKTTPLIFKVLLHSSGETRETLPFALRKGHVKRLPNHVVFLKLLLRQAPQEQFGLCIRLNNGSLKVCEVNSFYLTAAHIILKRVIFKLLFSNWPFL